jgi:hypothetical protein
MPATSFPARARRAMMSSIARIPRLLSW